MRRSSLRVINSNEGLRLHTHRYTRIHTSGTHVHLRLLKLERMASLLFYSPKTKRKMLCLKEHTTHVQSANFVCVNPSTHMNTISIGDIYRVVLLFEVRTTLFTELFALKWVTWDNNSLKIENKEKWTERKTTWRGDRKVKTIKKVQVSNLLEICTKFYFYFQHPNKSSTPKF